MSTLSRENRRLLENTVALARAIAEEGARKVLRDQYAVHHDEPWAHMKDAEGDSPEVRRDKDSARKLRNQLRAHGRQLGDKRDAKRETQEIKHLAQACAYEHWHRMLFARFLAENDLLLDAQHGVAMTLDDIRELAREQGRDWMEVAAELAQRMLLAVFRPDDPVLKVQLPPEAQQQLEEKLASLPKEVFHADDSLGWVYQFWQSEEKDRINDSGVKIGADELPAVTELFTEDYMVWFLLHNTLGAWWTAKRKAEGKNQNLPGYEWTYLRLKEDGMPAAGSFEGWPRWAKDIKLLDPSMGSGHFLVFALPILVAFRVEEEGLTREEAVEAVLRDNLFGLEIDPRCTQIAAFNLAWTAWRMVGYRPLPQLNLACSGLGINAKEEDWVKLAGRDERARETMRRLYHLFEQAPVLGSLIDPKRIGGSLFTVEFEEVRPLLQIALTDEHSDEGEIELAVTAQGLVTATSILTDEFTLVVTNVPYLGRGKQNEVLKEYCDRYHPAAKADLATCFVERALGLTPKGATLASVVTQNWLFLGRYKTLRERALKTHEWNVVARLGARAFETISGEIVSVALTVLTNSRADNSHCFAAFDVGSRSSPAEKSDGLRRVDFSLKNQLAQLANPDGRIVLDEIDQGASTLSDYVESYQGAVTGDLERFTAFFWEIDATGSTWEPFRTAIETADHDNGLMRSIRWERGNGQLADYAKQAREQLHDMHESGQRAWGQLGIAINRMTNLLCTRYTGMKFDNNVAVLIPRSGEYMLPILAFCSSENFPRAVRALDQTLKVTNQTLRKVPFRLSDWQEKASELWPGGIPTLPNFDPSQWVFDGRPNHSNSSLQVAVCRLLDYRWPRQTGHAFLDCPSLGPDGLEKHADADGVVPLNAIAGAASGAHRLRELLAASYGSEWSAARLHELLGDWDSLEDWLRDGFFEEHCQLFHQRPFVWHVWDGRKDGFHALLNYHKLSAPNGEGRQALEKLIYTYLGRWIERQSDEVRNGKEGADARLTAATHLKAELEKILEGEKPYDIFVRWKPLHEQPIGWEPDINDGVRLNVRPWLTAKVYQPSRRDGCILRVTPRIPHGKDRGNEPHRPKEDFPWFWTWDGQTENFTGGDKLDGARWNDLHYSLAKKKEAREKQSSAAVSAARGTNR